MRKTINIRYAAKAATAALLTVPMLGLWAIYNGPYIALRDQGTAAAEQHNTLEFLQLLGLQMLMLPALIIGTGLVMACILMAYTAFERWHTRQVFAGAKNAILMNK